MRCNQVASRATDYTEGAVGPWLGWRMRRHLAGCADCRTYVAQLQATARALSLLASGEVDAAHQARAMQAFAAWQGRGLAPIPAETGWLVVGLMTGVAAVLSAAASRSHAPLGRAWLEAGVVAAAACGLALLAGRRGMLAAGLAVVAAFAMALLAGAGGPLAAMQLRCSMHEIATAVIPVVALLRLGPTGTIARAPLIGVAAAGALAGDAALHVACPDAGSLAHVLVFHVGGVVATLGIAALGAERLLRFRRIA